MLKRYVMLAAMIGLVVLVPSGPATGVAKRTHECTITTRSAFIELDSGFPNIGTTAESVALNEQSCDGGKTTRGAGEFRVTITGVGGGTNAISSAPAQAPLRIQFKTEGISYFERGTIKGTSTGTSTVEPDGSSAVSGKSKTTGGTGLYRGATGSGTFTGSLSPNLVNTSNGTATLSY